MLLSNSNKNTMNIDVSKLSYQQHQSFEDACKSLKFINIAINISEKQLIESFKREGVSIGNEVPFKGLLVSLASCGCHLTSIEQRQLLLALSRTPETKIISIPLFLSLYRHWKKIITEKSNSLPSSESFSYNDKVKSDNSIKITQIRHMLELQLPNIAYILDIIPQRISTEISPDVSTEKFARILRNSNVNLSNDNYMLLITALRRTGICSESDNINFNKFIEVCRSKDIISNNNDNYVQAKSDKATSLLKLLEVCRQKWSELEKKILSSSWNKDNISASTFQLMCNACGIQFAEKDIFNLWAHINMLSNHSKMVNTEENIRLRTLSLPQIRKVVIGSTESTNFSCMGNVMRDSPAKHIRKNKFQEQPSTIGNILQQVQSTPQNSMVHSAVSPPTALPWSSSEATEENNLKTRVKSAFKHITSEKYRSFIDLLHKSTYASKGLITRFGLSEALLSINLRLNKNDSEDFWSQGNRFSRGSFTVETFGQWMDIDVDNLQEVTMPIEITLEDKFEGVSSARTREYQNQQKHHFNVNQESIPETEIHTGKHHYMKTQQLDSLEDTSLHNTGKHHYMKTQQLESYEDRTAPIHSNVYAAHNLQDSATLDKDFHSEKHHFVENQLKDHFIDNQLTEFTNENQHHGIVPQNTYLAHNMQESDVWNTTASNSFKQDNYDDTDDDSIPPLPPISMDESNIDVLNLLPRVPYRYSHHNSNHVSGVLSSHEDFYNKVEVEANKESEMKERNEAIVQLQDKRPHLAVFFRKRIGLGSRLVENSIKCKDLALELLQPPFSLKISENIAWRLVCDMIGANYLSNPDDTYILFADVINFLDMEKVTDENYLKNQMKHSLKRKLFDSKQVQGDKVNLYALTSSLRQRQRCVLGRGSNSWDASPDYCSVKELVRLLESIDICVTLEEAKFICMNASDDDQIHTNDLNVRLGAAILFLGNIIDF